MKTKYKILIAKIIYKILSFIISKNQVVTRSKIKWNLDLQEGIDLSIFLFGTSEKKIFNLKKLLPQNETPLTIIDIGANIGSVSLVMAQMFNNCKVYAIEPTHYAFEKLSNNLHLNQKLLNKVILKQLFISNNKKPNEVWSSWNLNQSENKHLKHKGTLKKIKQNSYVQLDKFILDEKIDNVDFIKLDVDGHELDVLKSGERFLKKNKPIIFVEIAPYLYPEFGYDYQQLINFIINLGYEFFNEDLKKVSDIFGEINKISDGSTKNFFLY